MHMCIHCNLVSFAIEIKMIHTLLLLFHKYYLLDIKFMNQLLIEITNLLCIYKNKHY